MSGDAAASAFRYGCPSCGGTLRYHISKGKLQCESCGGMYDADDIPENEETQGESEIPITAYRCPQCGAEIAGMGTDVTDHCSFCGSNVILPGKMSSMRKPDRIVPFRISREQCETLYLQHLKKHRFAPDSLSAAENLGRFCPVYIPYWCYKVTSEGPLHLFSVRREEKCWERTYSIRGIISCEEKDILYDASAAFEDETAARLSHDMNDSAPFRGSYLCGMYAQAANVPPDIYAEEAKASMTLNLVKELNKQYGDIRFPTDEKTKEEKALPKPIVEHELVLLPVWLSARREGGRVLYAAVNGQNGKVVCDVPVSAGKAALFTLMTAALLFVLLYFIAVLEPNWMPLYAAAAALASHYFFTLALRRLLFRKKREAEPDFSRPGAFSGPAQVQLRLAYCLTNEGRLEKRKKPSASDKAAEYTSTAFYRLFILLACVSFVPIAAPTALFLHVFGIYTLEGILLSRAYLITFSIYWIIMLIQNIGINISLPEGHEKKRNTIHLYIIESITAASAVLSALRQAEDWIYYGTAIMLLLAAIAELAVLGRLFIRFATRPVPFFGEEAEKS